MSPRQARKRVFKDDPTRQWWKTDNTVATDYPALISEDGDDLISEDGADLIPEDAAF